jgi:hypothetical protein
MNLPKWIVIDVKASKNYELHLSFANGKKGAFNFISELQKPIYQRLKDLDFFLTAHVEDGTVVWNEELDIAPEYLYENS